MVFPSHCGNRENPGTQFTPSHPSFHFPSIPQESFLKPTPLPNPRPLRFPSLFPLFHPQRVLRRALNTLSSKLFLSTPPLRPPPSSHNTRGAPSLPSKGGMNKPKAQKPPPQKRSPGAPYLTTLLSGDVGVNQSSFRSCFSFCHSPQGNLLFPRHRTNANPTHHCPRKAIIHTENALFSTVSVTLPCLQ